MKAAELYRRAISLGLRLEPRGEMLAVIPAERVAPAFAALLRQHKADLLAWLSSPSLPGWQAETPDSLPLNLVMPQPTPQNRERVINYVCRQADASPCRMRAWIVRREAAYYDGPGRHWDCALHAYAAARDIACWQLARNESEVWELLAGFDSVNSIDNAKGT